MRIIEKKRYRVDMKKHLSRFAVAAFMLALIPIFSGLFPSTFFTHSNALAMLESESVILPLAIGVTLTLRLGDLDLSFGAIANFSATTIGVLTVEHHVGSGSAVIIALICGLVFGLVNGLLVVGLGLNSFVATLGTMTAIEGLTYGISNSQVIPGIPGGITSISSSSWLSIPLAVWFGWALVVAAWIIYERTRYGRYLLFVGGNRRAANIAGVPTWRVRMVAYVGSGLIYGFCGFILAATLGSADPSIGTQYLLPPLAAAFLGSTTIQVGRFNAIGTLVGAYLLMLIGSGLELAGVASWATDIFDGAALVAAIILAKILAGRSGGGVEMGGYTN